MIAYVHERKKMNEESLPIDIGIDETTRVATAEGLSRVLADTYTLYLKTHNYHWNVTGPMFQSLHMMFEQHYIDLSEAVDLIAERIRTLGVYVPASFKEFQTLTAIDEDEMGAVLNSETMVRNLLVGHETVARTIRETLKMVGETNDESTADILTQRLSQHEKTAWMLRSLTE